MTLTKESNKRYNDAKLATVSDVKTPKAYFSLKIYFFCISFKSFCAEEKGLVL